jgi:hypothetical protein
MKETVPDALWMGVLAGLGAVVIEAILLASFYLFDPAAKKIIEDHSISLVISFPVIFVAAFGLSLQFALEGQFWRGKWK